MRRSVLELVLIALLLSLNLPPWNIVAMQSITGLSHA